MVLTLRLEDASGNAVTDADLKSATLTMTGLTDKCGDRTAGPDNTLTFTLAAAAHAPGLTAAIQLSNWIMQVETDP
ncbi:hypothetical protein, partial [Enterobacter roggenkampii]|uniref:hypothetical protein n=1 Tax=Enterobacter roggenkampii TaxID=1812935 RepID=UPI002A7FCC55